MILEEKTKMIETNIAFKQNPIIRGFFKNNTSLNSQELKQAELNIESINNSFTLLNNLDLDILNYLYYKMQQKHFNYQAITYTNRRDINLSFLEIKEALKIKHKGFKKEITKSLENIYAISLYLKNFLCPHTGHKIDAQHTRIISSLMFQQNAVNIEFTDIFMLNILRHPNKQINKKVGNFTAIDTSVTLAIKSKYGKRLYEYIISFQGAGQRNHLCLNITNLNTLFGTNYTELSRFKLILERCYPKIIPYLKFNYLVLKKDKKVCFDFFLEKKSLLLKEKQEKEFAILEEKINKEIEKEEKALPN